jgi:hypothetical protein
VKPADFSNRATEREASDRVDAIKMTMPSGSLAITKRTLWHRGGANRSDRSRLIVTPQYCVGWVRQLENMCLAVPPEIAVKLPERVRDLIGYSIHPPFMGHVDGFASAALAAHDAGTPISAALTYEGRSEMVSRNSTISDVSSSGQEITPCRDNSSQNRCRLESWRTGADRSQLRSGHRQRQTDAHHHGRPRQVRAKSDP